VGQAFGLRRLSEPPDADHSIRERSFFAAFL